MIDDFIYNNFLDPSKLSPAELDDYLSLGWFRTSNLLFFSTILTTDRPYSTVWLRLPLEQYTPSKSHRKQLKTVKERFEIRIRPLKLTTEKNVLFEKYIQSKNDITIKSISDLLGLQKESDNNFNSFEICMYDADTLIACSIFDKGMNSLASISGFYDPDYAKFSLGIMTMHLEIEYGIKQGFEYYYPGYFLEGSPRFEYKKKISKYLEFYDSRHKIWLPMTDYQANKYAYVELLISKLTDLKILLNLTPSFRYGSQIKFYGGYTNYLFIKKFSFSEPFEHPFYLLIFDKNTTTREKILVAFNPIKNVYELHVCLFTKNEDESIVLAHTPASVFSITCINQRFQVLGTTPQASLKLLSEILPITPTNNSNL